MQSRGESAHQSTCSGELLKEPLLQLTVGATCGVPCIVTYSYLYLSFCRIRIHR